MPAKSTDMVLIGANAARKPRRYIDEENRSQMKLIDIIGTLRDQRDHGDMIDMWQVAQALIVCGLPYDEVKATQWQKKARLGDGSELQVSFAATQKGVSLPFGQDRGPLYYLINCAIRKYKQIEESLPPDLDEEERKKRLDTARFVEWSTAADYLDTMGKRKDGAQYKALKERLQRLRFCAISVRRVTKNTDESLVAPLVRASRVPQWAKTSKMDDVRVLPITTGMEKVEQPCGFELGIEFFHDIVKFHGPVPEDVIKTLLTRPKYLDLFILMQWRAFAAKTDSFIPFSDLRDQIGTSDTNDSRLAADLRKTIALVRGTGWKEFRAEVRVYRNRQRASGLLIGPPLNGVQFSAPTEKNKKKITASTVKQLAFPRD